MSGLRPTGKMLKKIFEVREEQLRESGHFEVALFFAIIFGSWMNLFRLIL